MDQIQGKPVIFQETNKIINLRSGFKEKLLCDGATFSLGTACVYSCAFCYVESTMLRLPVVQEATQSLGKAFHELVIRRKNALESMKAQLLDSKGKPKFKQPNDRRVIYASPLVDVAATIELAKETIQACLLILELTNWDIRLLSKSNLLPYIASHIPAQYQTRMIYGVSTGTLDDKLAKAFEEGTPLVSKRINSLHTLQDMGLRTFGMVCPSIPQDDYDQFSADIMAALRIERCEHVWAEVMNVRGDSMTRTCLALENAGYGKQAGYVRAVAASTDSWEEYSRHTFLAHKRHVPANKLRFLQYVNPTNLDWWLSQMPHGAVLLGHQATSL